MPFKMKIKLSSLGLKYSYNVYLKRLISVTLLIIFKYRELGDNLLLLTFVFSLYAVLIVPG